MGKLRPRKGWPRLSGAARRPLHGRQRPSPSLLPPLPLAAEGRDAGRGRGGCTWCPRGEVTGGAPEVGLGDPGPWLPAPASWLWRGRKLGRFSGGPRPAPLPASCPRPAPRRHLRFLPLLVARPPPSPRSARDPRVPAPPDLCRRVCLSVRRARLDASHICLASAIASLPGLGARLTLPAPHSAPQPPLLAVSLCLLVFLSFFASLCVFLSVSVSPSLSLSLSLPFSPLGSFPSALRYLSSSLSLSPSEPFSSLLWVLLHLSPSQSFPSCCFQGSVSPCPFFYGPFFSFYLFLLSLSQYRCLSLIPLPLIVFLFSCSVSLSLDLCCSPSTLYLRNSASQKLCISVPLLSLPLGLPTIPKLGPQTLQIHLLKATPQRTDVAWPEPQFHTGPTRQSPVFVPVFVGLKY
nr:uncharacterized protein LOC111775429 [Equus caballus]XP_023507202.1 uncharacterized protein LOC111775429 [Equus caballus]